MMNFISIIKMAPGVFNDFPGVPFFMVKILFGDWCNVVSMRQYKGLVDLNNYTNILTNCTYESKAIPITCCGDLRGCETLKIPH
jgi:hypothetical protein